MLTGRASGATLTGRAPSGATRTGRVGAIRIVHLIGQLGLGGSERQLLVLLHHLGRERFESHLVVFNPSPHGELHREFEQLGIPVITVPPECRRVARRVRFLWRTCRRLAPDVIHSWTAHDNPYAGVVGRLAGVRARFGSLRTTLHSTLMANLPGSYRWLVLHGVAELVVNSETCARELRELGIRPRRIRLLRNCVPMATADPAPADLADLGVEASHRVVGLIGNLRAVKDHLFFVDAMARVLPEVPELRVLLVGQPLPSEPDYPRRIEERIERHGLGGRFVITGFRPDVPELLRRMEVCCLTSKSEGMPNVVLEAMAAARPVVATRVGGVPELIEDGDGGALIEPGDVRGFAAAVSRLLAEPELARRMGRRGRERAEKRHGCGDAARRLGNFYRSALGKTPEEDSDR